MYVYLVHPIPQKLTAAGTISAVYPPTPVLKPHSRTTGNDWKRVEWTVDAEVDGTMIDKATGLEVSYLFWEGECSSSYACVAC